MSKHHFLFWALPVCALLAVSCNKNESQQAGEGTDKKVIATYDKGELTESEINQEIMKLTNQNPELRNNKITYDTLDPQVKQTIIKEIIAQRLMAEEAKEKGFEKEPEVKERIQTATNRILAQEYIQAKGEELVTEEKIRAFYDKQVSDYTKKEEFHASHILVKGEDEAKAIMAQIQQDKTKFAAIAREKSIDATKVNGGDLGYFIADAMVPEFAEAVKNMKVDEVAGPIKTDFGWHIVWLQDRRQAVPISYEKARPRIERDLRQEAVRSFVDGAIQKANVVYVDPSITEAEAKAKAQQGQDGQKPEGQKSQEAEQPKSDQAAPAAAQGQEADASATHTPAAAKPESANQ